MHWLLWKENYAEQVGAEATVYMSAMLEYLTTEILELAGYIAQDNKKKQANLLSPVAHHP